MTNLILDQFVGLSRGAASLTPHRHELRQNTPVLTFDLRSCIDHAALKHLRSAVALKRQSFRTGPSELRKSLPTLHSPPPPNLLSMHTIYRKHLSHVRKCYSLIGPASFNENFFSQPISSWLILGGGIKAKSHRSTTLPHSLTDRHTQTQHTHTQSHGL